MNKTIRLHHLHRVEGLPDDTKKPDIYSAEGQEGLIDPDEDPTAGGN